MIQKSTGVTLTILAYFFLYSVLSFFKLGEEMTTSPQKLLQRQELPERQIARELGPGFVVLEKTARNQDKVCLAEEPYQEIMASRSAFLPYFVQQRSVTVCPDEVKL